MTASAGGNKGTVTKSELIERIAERQTQLGYKDVELAVKSILELMAQTLASGERIEIRGFGSFSLHYRPSRVGRNPKTGEPVSLPEKFVPHFKPGKELRDRVDAAAAEAAAAEAEAAAGRRVIR
jgi:integration host factor subunit beta